MRGHTETAHLLVDKGADVNQCDEVYCLYTNINMMSVGNCDRESEGHSTSGTYIPC